MACNDMHPLAPLPAGGLWRWVGRPVSAAKVAVGDHVTLDVASTGAYWKAAPSGLWLFIAVPWSIMYVGCLALVSYKVSL